MSRSMILDRFSAVAGEETVGRVAVQIGTRTSPWENLQTEKGKRPQAEIDGSWVSRSMILDRFSALAGEEIVGLVVAVETRSLQWENRLKRRQQQIVEDAALMEDLTATRALAAERESRGARSSADKYPRILISC